VWTVSCGGNSTTKLRVSDGANLGTFPVGACPGPIAFDGNSIWLASYADGSLTKMRPTDGAILGTFTGIFGPEGIVFDGASIWVANPFAESVSRF
jgi:DNA-binding beta-propeller fold protein YncE